MPLSLLALLLVSAPAQSRLATDSSPAVIRPVVDAAARCAANPQLVVALTHFTPPSGAPAALVVSLRTADGRTTELGRAGIFPSQPFAAPLAEAKRFGFAVPKRALAQDPVVVVTLRSDAGPAPGARATIAEARIAAAPSDRC